MSPLPTALVVDDDPGFCRFARGALRTVGFQVVEAGDAWTALRLLGTPPLPRIICLDLMLPGVSGYELCERIRADPTMRGIPVLAVSARTYPQDIALARTVGAQAVLTKPVRLATLRNAALMLLQQERPAAQAG